MVRPQTKKRKGDIAPVKYPGKLGARPGYNPSQEFIDSVYAALKLDDADRRRIIEHLGHRAPRRERLQHQLEGVMLLFQHYQIAAADPLVMYTELALALAKDHVPYFMPPTRIGAPKTLQWAFPLLGGVLDAVEKNRRKEIYSVFAKLTSTQVETLQREFNRWRKKQGESLPH